ncbi:MAG: hypothetical protein IJM18_00475 [Clostridia bacterium]|nr:hypothetical protein [Clostridia bacterium]
MAGYTYKIGGFVGIDQSRDENLIPPAYSPDAVNMDTSDGGLAVTKGFSKLLPPPVPQESTSGVDRICFFRGASKEIPMAISGGVIYNYNETSGAWLRAYTYSLVLERRHYSVLMTRIGTTDTMLIADGANRILKFDGEEFSLFGSEAGCSDITVSYIAMYRSRLFAAGNYDYPNRLYYSKLPGGERTIEDWGYDEDSPSVEGGHIEIGTTSGDPITAICAMSNQLLIFKKSSIYRLIGDRPGNFNVELIMSDSTFVSDTATAVYRDLIYYVTEGGLHCFNGVDAAPMPDARMIKRIMKGADTSDSRMAVAGDKLYFTIKKNGGTRLIEYDITERRYMQYGGFTAFDLVSKDGRLILANGARYFEIWGEGDSFDGADINAYWTTPLTDLNEKSVIKSLQEMYLRGACTGSDMLIVDTFIGKNEDSYRVLLPETEAEVLEIPLKNEGRTLKLRFRNEAGGHFRLTGGAEIGMNVRRRTE